MYSMEAPPATVGRIVGRFLNCIWYHSTGGPRLIVHPSGSLATVNLTKCWLDKAPFLCGMAIQMVVPEGVLLSTWLYLFQEWTYCSLSIQLEPLTPVSLSSTAPELPVWAWNCSNPRSVARTVVDRGAVGCFVDCVRLGKYWTKTTKTLAFY